MTQKNINIATLVVNSAIKKNEKRNGRDVIVIPSSTLPFNVIMNNILYTEEQIKRVYPMLNNKPAPIGHPKNADGKHISALSPEGLNQGYVGAWAENARIEDGKVKHDVIVDVLKANESDLGKELLKRIDEGKPISTSISVWAEEIAVKGDGYGSIANINDIDHNAILFSEPPAAGIEKGVGLFVNSADATPYDPNASDKKQDETMIRGIVDKFLRFISNKEGSSMTVEEENAALKAKIAELEKKLEDKKPDDDKSKEQKPNEDGKKKEDDKGNLQNNAEFTALQNTVAELQAQLKNNTESELKPLRERVDALLGNTSVSQKLNKEELLDILNKNGGVAAPLGNSHHQGGALPQGTVLRNHEQYMKDMGLGGDK